ncbi:hypothetical protein HGO40_02145 [Pseudomonas sp. CG7]|uniref:hypothetical protein n=1 Tax=Pseudomonas sp. CG7 TaxID=191007 RepID=UPI0020340371|nr:hypothetical protein [Pseudomonas sp. CG7]MCM2459316.1 hypothetical protein [Pseudomonas sp. CG7]
MSKFSNIYPRGHFFQQLGGAHYAQPKDMQDERGFFGLVPSATFAYGNLKSEDDEMYEIVRRFSHHGTAATGEEAEDMGRPPVLLLFQSTELDHEHLRYDLPTMMQQAPTDNARIYMEGDKAIWEQAEKEQGGAFRLTFEGETFTWSEEDIFALSGTIMRPGLQWYLPGRDYGTFYVSQIFQVSGEVRGKKVTGIIAYDQTYMGEGGDLYVNKDLVMQNRGHVIWYTWATRYEDGSWENGHFMLGNGPLGFALFTDGKTVTSTRDITGRVIPQEGSPFAKRIELTIDGEPWEFIPEPRGTMPDMMRKHPPTPQQEGRWQRVGETRKPVTWFAWGETEPDHGLTPADKLPTEPIYE